VTSAHTLATGVVSFLDNSTSIGSGAIGAGGVATFSTNRLATGSQTIVAVYSGDNNFYGSTSSSLTQTVTRGSVTSVSLTSNVAPSSLGQGVTFTASVVGPAAAPTGTVTFELAGTSLGTLTLGGSGQATFSTATLPQGADVLTAVYGGDTNYSGQTSAGYTQNVVSTTSGLNIVKGGQVVNPINRDQMAQTIAVQNNGAAALPGGFGLNLTGLGSAGPGGSAVSIQKVTVTVGGTTTTLAAGTGFFLGASGWEIDVSQSLFPGGQLPAGLSFSVSILFQDATAPFVPGSPIGYGVGTEVNQPY
jgi:hypothetical protein